jgi:hypothetical protein
MSNQPTTAALVARLRDTFERLAFAAKHTDHVTRAEELWERAAEIVRKTAAAEATPPVAAEAASRDHLFAELKLSREQHAQTVTRLEQTRAALAAAERDRLLLAANGVLGQGTHEEYATAVKLARRIVAEAPPSGEAVPAAKPNSLADRVGYTLCPACMGSGVVALGVPEICNLCNGRMHVPVEQ